tara:strand:+ start:2697 stop:4229 length:1533 start_codon:yes stop_codon:yes gene_type:complete
MRADLIPSRPIPHRLNARRFACLSNAVLILAAVLVLGAGAPQLAQAQTAQPAAEDLRALIYYLDNDDQRSVQAEMRRLRAQFPRWTPPSDVRELRAQAVTGSTAVDVAPIWSRIERNDYAGARALIDQARNRVPGWSPDAEMLRVLEINESQAAFDSAFAQRDPAAALAAARRTPALMRCDRINNAWRLAELYAQSEQMANAVSTYRGVLSSCRRLSDAVPTLEKANEVASWPQMEELFDVARTAQPTNGDRLTQLQDRLRAGRGGAVARATPRRATPSPAAPAAAASAPARAAPAARTTAVAAVPPSAAVPLGSLALRGDRRIAQVRRLKEQGNWQACLSASSNPRSLEMLYERSWCAYNLERSGEALAGFTAIAQRGSGLGGDVPRDTRFGMILSYLALNMTEQGAQVAAATNLTRQQRVEVETTILDQRGVRSYLRREYAQSIAYFNALEDLSGPLRRDLAMLRAYAYLNNDQPQLARTEFTRLHNELATDETRSALQSLSNIMSAG